MQLPDVSVPFWFLMVSLAFFSVVIGRYVLIAGVFHLVFYTWFPGKWKERKLSSKKYSLKQFKRELLWSFITASIFAVAGTLTLLLWQKGYTKIYSGILEYGWLYLPVSLILSLLLHETYYYWLHRWMHRPTIFRIVHKVHHQSTITSPWTAFSFHPLEGVLQSLALPCILLIIPLHPAIVIIQLTIMTFSSVINHLDIEIYPKSFQKNIIGRWLIGATHHSLHHKQFKYNFGLYFTFWDKWKKTESPAFHQLFDRITSITGKKESE